MTETRQYPADDDTWDGHTERPPPNGSIQLDDASYMRKWITALREQVDQGLNAAEDATRPVQERVLSRHEARRRIEKATETIYNLLDAAERGLP
ncbi:hypothetical protein [Sorangium sp. So ce1000]|uniref:hypothetical protein n=1 Tax=Sorangium sp. So ce1000 TaxID=3133325 RepID=UPI003F5E2BE3